MESKKDVLELGGKTLCGNPRKDTDFHPA